MKYFEDPTRWESLRLINTAAEVPFDCDIGSHCLSGKKLANDSLNAISLDDKIKEQEQKLFKYYSFSCDTHARQEIYLIKGYLTRANGKPPQKKKNDLPISA